MPAAAAVGVALILALVGTVTWVVMHSAVVQEARQAGFSPPRYVLLVDITDRARKRTPLTGADMAALRLLSNDAHPLMRARALTALFYLGGSGNASLAGDIARRKLHDPHPIVRQYALSALDHLNAPDVLIVAQSMLSDAAENVRDKAERVIQKRLHSAPVAPRRNGARMPSG